MDHLSTSPAAKEKHCNLWSQEMFFPLKSETYLGAIASDLHATEAVAYVQPMSVRPMTSIHRTDMHATRTRSPKVAGLAASARKFRFGCGWSHVE
jgi:hypothetical protein